MNDHQQILQVYLQEYNKLKDEQAKRIGFRDNLLYVTLGLFGGIISISISNQSNYYAFLVIPWVCLILGWTYLVNDQKITAIGRYIRYNLVKEIQKAIPDTSVEQITQETNYPKLETILGWEIAHRSDKHRIRRKIEQLIIDQITFVFSGVIALLAFWLLVPQPLLIVNIFAVVELILLLILGIEISVYADISEGR